VPDLPTRLSRLPGLARDAALALRQRNDLALLLALVVLAAGAWAFAGIAEVVAEGEGRAVEEQVLLAFRTAGDTADPIGSDAIEEAVRDLTSLGGVLLTSLATLLAAAFFLLDRRPRAASFLVGSILGGVAVTFALKAGFDRPRPDIVAHGMHALSASFPSGHSATAAVVYLTLGALIARSMPRVRLRVFVVAVALVLTLAIGVSRLYLGVHWPTDVLAGWTVGAGWALAAWLVARHLRRRGWIESSQVLSADDSAPDD
jgi:undecaprenyl-diphosphatase